MPYEHSFKLDNQFLLFFFDHQKFNLRVIITETLCKKRDALIKLGIKPKLKMLEK